MGTTKNITVFPKLFLEPKVKKLFESFEYHENTVVNEDLDVHYNPYYSFKLIPEYFKLNTRNSKYTIKKIPQHNWGYSILLNSVNTIEDFMLKQFNGKKRNIIRRYVNRLEACLNVQYKLYHGRITKKEYAFIMESLKNMILDRFRELNEVHKNIREWDYLIDSTYDRIINKTASLFVIYNDKEPIEVSLNYHYDKVLFSYVSSYNVDYSKFGLGHIEIYKQVEWCTKNDYILFEMGVGGMDYKRRWSNNIYRYYHYIAYSNRGILAGIYNVFKYRAKEYLKSKKPEKALKRTKKQNKGINTTLVPSKIVTINDNLIKKICNATEVDYNDDLHGFLKRSVFDFLYTTIDHISNIKTYKINNREYLIKGKNNSQTIGLN